MTRGLDCLIIGGGPAGLTAAIYLARFRRRFLLFDGNSSRASWIPTSHNHAGYPEGVSGMDLLASMRQQAERYGAKVVSTGIARLGRSDDGSFAATDEAGQVHRAQTVILATGTEDVPPPIGLPRLEEAVARGLLRYCPICDAYEIRGRRISLASTGKCRVREAMLLRTYTADLSVLTLGNPWDLAEEERETLTSAGVKVVEEPVTSLDFGETDVTVTTSGGVLKSFDAIYVALGLKARSDLAVALGAAHDEDGALLVDQHQQTRVPGLYAAGDVVQGLAQISVAMGHAAIAATAVHNQLPFRWATEEGGLEAEEGTGAADPG